MSSCNLVGLTVTQITVAGVQIRIRGEAGNALDGLHGRSIRTGVRDVIAAGYALPGLDFYPTSSQNVPNVAMKTYTNGALTPIIVLGPKMWSKNPKMPGTANLVVGGMSTTGPRGVTDQIYDGTTRCFGNPKQKAQGATIVIDELGHILHEIANPGIFWEELEAAEALVASPDAPGWQNEAPSVSAYAGNNALEFVAEVFTGQMVGKNYPGTVIAKYNNLGGP